VEEVDYCQEKVRVVGRLENSVREEFSVEISFYKYNFDRVSSERKIFCIILVGICFL
jgi:hypothetical protein